MNTLKHAAILIATFIVLAVVTGYASDVAELERKVRAFEARQVSVDSALLEDAYAILELELTVFGHHKQIAKIER